MACADVPDRSCPIEGDEKGKRGHVLWLGCFRPRWAWTEVIIVVGGGGLMRSPFVRRSRWLADVEIGGEQQG
jgi:hypothetical protein